MSGFIKIDFSTGYVIETLPDSFHLLIEITIMV